jgi:hypothetical protein
MAVKKDTLIAELQFVSDRLSERSRLIAAGVIAIWWATLVGDKAPPHLTAKDLLPPVICASVSILADLLQYVVAYVHNQSALRTLEKMGAAEFVFDTRNLGYKARSFLFALKQVAALVAIGWLIVIIARQLWA